MAYEKGDPLITITGKPLSYQGKDYDKIHLLMPPFGDAASVYHELRKKIGVRHLYNGNPQTAKLTSYQIHDLHSEALAYLTRGVVKRMNHVHLAEEITDYDTAKAILKIIINQSQDKSEEEISKGRRDFVQMNLLMALGDYALIIDRNYERARYLFQSARNLSEEINQSILHDSPHLMISLSQDGNAQEGLSNMMRGFDKKIEEVSIMQGDDRDHHNMMTDESYHPQSLQARLEESRTAEDFESLKTLNEMIDGLDLQLISKDLSPFIEHVTRRMAIELAPNMDLNFQEGKVSLRYSKDIPFKRGLLAAEASEEKESRIIEVFDSDLYTRVFGLTQGDPYVMMFGRFSTKVAFK